MRDGFRELAEVWSLLGLSGDVDADFRTLSERIERLADWVLVHGGAPEMLPDERQEITAMLRQHLVLGCQVFGLGVPSL